MMSTVGVELTSFINPDLTWKTVSKGNRSGTRRTRIPGTSSFTKGMGLAEKNSRTVKDVTVSESEKLGVDVLGRRFSENVEHVPIKKRRFVFRSPSSPPPLTPPPHLEASGQHVDFQSASGQTTSSNSTQKRRFMKSNFSTKSTVPSISYEKLPEVKDGDEDFSGIEILAAAACGDSIVDDITEKNECNSLVQESAEERVESSASAIPLEETTAPSETACCSTKDSVDKDKTDCSSFQVDNVSVLDESHRDKENSTEDSSMPLPGDRFLWDLNLSMDAWPCEGGNVDSQKDSVDNISMVSEVLQTKPSVGNADSEKEGVDNISVASEVLQTKPSVGGTVDSQKDVADNIFMASEVLQTKPYVGGNVDSRKYAVDNIYVETEVLQTKPSVHVNVDLQKDGVDNLSVETEVLQTKPSVGGNVDSQKNGVDNISMLREELQTKEPQDIELDNLNNIVSPDVDGDNKMTADLRTLPVGADGLSKEKQESEGCSGSSENNNEHVSVPVVDAENSLMSTAVDTIASTESDDNFVPEKDQETSLSAHKFELNMVGCISEAEVGKTACIESVQVEALDVASPYLPVLGTVSANEIQSASANKDEKDRNRTYGLDDVKCSAQDLDIIRHPKSHEVGHANGAEEMEICHFSPKSEDMSISDDYTMDSTERTDGASSAYHAEVDSVGHVGSEVLMQKSSRNENVDFRSGAGDISTHEAIYVNGPPSYLDKANLNDPPKEFHGSAVSQDNILAVGMGNHSELQAGYDSQFEDGELRESDIQCWEEAEQVDYDTEFEEERSLGLESDSGEQKLKVERGSSPDVSENFKYCETGEALRENSVSLKMKALEVPGGETRKSDFLDGSNVAGYDLRVDLSKESKKELHSQVEVSLSSEAVQRSRSNNFYGSYPRSERDGFDKFTGRERSTSQMRGRSPGSGYFFNPSANYWDSKRQHAPIYHGPCNFGRPRPKSVVESRGYPMPTGQAPSESAGVARPDNRMNREFMGPSNGVYRTPLRRRSPVERDDSYGMHTRMPTIRETSPDRTRFRRYPQGVNRGIRDEYMRHIPDDGTEYFSRMPHRLGRRERSISPVGGIPHYTVPYKRTRSRSRSRSPIGWLPQRDRNEGSRRRSRSPDFRSDARADRVRLPFTKRFGTEYGEEFIPPPRNRISPQRNSRMFEDRNSGLDHFKGRKSPVRMFRQGQRFDQVRPNRRLNSNDYFRPMIRPRRFIDTNAGGKGSKYEGNDDDKHGSRYEMIHRARRYDTDGAVRRFRQNEEHSYVANNSLTTVTDEAWGLM